MAVIMNILHVVTAVFIIGPMAILPMTGMRAIKTGQGGQVAVLAKSTFLFTLLSLLVVLFGFGVMGMSKYDISVSTPWILISIVLYVIALILNLAIVVPAMRRAGRRLGTDTGALPIAVDSGDAAAAASARNGGTRTASATTGNEYTLVAMGSGISSIMLLVIVILMVWKP